MAGVLAEQLNNRGLETELLSIEKINEARMAPLIQDAKTIIFAYPVYGGAMPVPMLRFIDAVPDTEKAKDAAIVCSQMLASGDGAWHYHKEIEEKGYEVKWAFHFRMPNNVSIKAWHLPYQSKPGAAEKALQKRKKAIGMAADKIADGEKSITGKGLLGKILGLMQRPAYLRMTKYPYKPPFSVDAGKCTLCMKCVKMCPEMNIAYEKGEIVHGTRCTLCMRCYNFCPTLAIEAYGKAHPAKKPPYRGPVGFDPLKLKS